MTKKLTIGVIFGGRSGEHEVSLNSARSVLSVIDRQRYDIIPVGITHSGIWLTGENVLDAFFAFEKDGHASTLQHLTPVTLLPHTGDSTLYAIRQNMNSHFLDAIAKLDVIFPILHGTFGEDGTLQGLLELTDVAYVGAGVLGSAVGMDKAIFKDIMRAHRIPVLASLNLTRAQIENLSEETLSRIEKLSPYPLFTKPANLGSSVGITKCRSRADLVEGLLDAARFDRRVLVERGLENPREIEVSVLGNDDPQASLPGEVIPSDDFYSYKAKYIDENSRLLIPAQLSPELIAGLQQTAVNTFKAIDACGMARVDFLIDRKDESIYVSEVNTIPGFTSISMYPKLWEATGLPYAELIDRLIDLALQRKVDRDRTERRYGSSK